MTRGCGRSPAATAGILTAIVLASIVGGGCSSSKTPKMQLIGADPNGKGFIESKSKQPFVPFGTNYYDPNTGWPPKVWQQFDVERVTYEFNIMNKLGVNCARVFLAAATFQPDIGTINPGALSKLDTLIKIAQRESAAHLDRTRPLGRLPRVLEAGSVCR